MKNSKLYILSVISGLLLAFGWFPHGYVWILFIAFVPLLIVEQRIFRAEEKYKSLTLFTCSLLAFFIWNVLTTWWIKNPSLGGAAMAILSNTLLMTIVFMVFHKVKKRVGEEWGMIVFICFWMSFEFMHLRWDLSWPWLTLGNAFADNPHLVQWYEYTGVFGGSLWILVINCLLVQAFKFKQSTEGNVKLFELTSDSGATHKMRAIVLIITLPILISYIILHYTEKYENGKLNVVVVQPNIDPYNEKFDGSYQEQIQKMLHLASQKTDSTTDYLLFPETAITENVWEGQLSQSESIKELKMFLKKFPKLTIVIGASSAREYKQGEALSVTARQYANDNRYFDYYNTALQIDNTDSIQIYHKSKLVPGVEKMPFPFIFRYFEKFAISLGGTVGSLGTQDERTAFVSKENIKTAPVICYESIYGEYVGEYINNGAEFISIITNDGWWGDTPGYKQHLKFGALRAIETRRWIARSANTGISCFISPLGEIQQATEWWIPDVIKQKIEPNDKITFYTRFGDCIARAAMLISFLLIIYSWLIRFKVIKKKVDLQPLNNSSKE